MFFLDCGRKKNTGYWKRGPSYPGELLRYNDNALVVVDYINSTDQFGVIYVLSLKNGNYGEYTRIGETGDKLVNELYKFILSAREDQN